MYNKNLWWRTSSYKEYIGNYEVGVLFPVS